MSNEKMKVKNGLAYRISCKARDLVDHPDNPRKHSDFQRNTLAANVAELGFIRPILCRPHPKHQHKYEVLDGHLRVEILEPDSEVPIDVVEANDAEARKILLSIDPIAALATTDLTAHNKLTNLVTTQCQSIEQLWQHTHDTALQMKEILSGLTSQESEEQNEKDEQKEEPEYKEIYQILVKCRDASHQEALLEKFKSEGLEVIPQQG